MVFVATMMMMMSMMKKVGSSRRETMASGRSGFNRKRWICRWLSRGGGIRECFFLVRIVAVMLIKIFSGM